MRWPAPSPGGNAYARATSAAESGGGPLAPVAGAAAARCGRTRGHVPRPKVACTNGASCCGTCSEPCRRRSARSSESTYAAHVAPNARTRAPTVPRTPIERQCVPVISMPRRSQYVRTFANAPASASVRSATAARDSYARRSGRRSHRVRAPARDRRHRRRARATKRLRRRVRLHRRAPCAPRPATPAPPYPEAERLRPSCARGRP